MPSGCSCQDAGHGAPPLAADENNIPAITIMTSLAEAGSNNILRYVQEMLIVAPESSTIL
jgi:hypothetical protein